MKKIVFIISVLVILNSFAACGKKNSDKVYYEIGPDGQIVEVKGEDEDNEASSTQTYSASSQFQTNGDAYSPFVDESDNPASANDDVIFSSNQTTQGQSHEAGEYVVSAVTDGVAMDFADEDYNTISEADKGKVAELKEIVNNAFEACKDTYINADKGEALNVTLNDSDISKMVSDIGSAGISCIDSLSNCNMAHYEPLNDFAMSINITKGLISGTYVVVYPDGHLTGYMLIRESGVWHLLAISGEWDRDNTYRLFSEGRYSVGGVKYTDRGWLIYSRNTTDFDDNQKANTDPYTMVKVLPYDDTARMLTKTYLTPISYFENNLFTTTWTDSNLAPIDFNSLYAYLFGMYHGTEMLSSYNVRSYYKAYQNTRLYVVPTESFETVVNTYFTIDSSALKAISDYSYDAGGYFFLGYNYNYYNVTPRTPTPEIISYTYNSDGSITMNVAAVNKWYGTDCAFEHTLTVMPTKTGFKYISNTLIENEKNIIPEQKLSQMLDVEKEKL